MASRVSSLFSNAISRILDSWTALQLAVEHHFGGAESQEKAKWMVFAIETWFKENDGIEPYEVEDFLEDVLNAEFDLRVEDNSIPEIAQLICLYYRLCQENRVEELEQRFQVLPKPSLKSCRKADEDMMDGEDSHNATPTLSSSASASSHQSADTGAVHSTASSGDVEEMETADQKATEDDGWQVIHHGRRKK